MQIESSFRPLDYDLRGGKNLPTRMTNAVQAQISCTAPGGMGRESKRSTDVSESGE